MMIKTNILQLHLLLKIGKKVKLATMFLSKLELEDTSLLLIIKLGNNNAI